MFCEENKIDVMAVNETKLDFQIGDNEIQMAGYNTVRKDRNKFGGGVCLYIKSYLNYSVRNDLMPDQLETIVIEINKPNSVPIFICTWYRPPGTSIELFDTFELFLEKIDSTNCELFVLGDLNCDLFSKDLDCYSKRLLELCELYNLTQMINEPTRVTLHTETLIDLCLTTVPENISLRGVSRTGISDHDIIYIVRKLNHFRTNRHYVVEKRYFKHFKQESFESDLKNVPWDGIQDKDPNRQWEMWKSLFIAVVDKHAPLKRTRMRKKRSPWLTSQLIKLIRKRDFLKKKSNIYKRVKCLE